MIMMTACKKNKAVQKLSMYVLLKQVTHVLRGAMKRTNKVLISSCRHLE